jgi:hypothetical protein
MDIYGKKVLVLGGWGLVGKAITRRLMIEKPSGIIITSLKESEAKEEVEYLNKTYPEAGANFFIPWWGNVLVRDEYKDISRAEMLADPVKRKKIISDVMDDLTDDVLEEQSLYKLLKEHKPDIVIDCINTATGIAYQDIFTAYKNLKKVLYESTDRDLLVYRDRKTCCSSLHPTADPSYSDSLQFDAQIRYKSLSENWYFRNRWHGVKHPLHSQRRETFQSFAE